VPEDLASLVTDCLAKKPEDRPANAREVAGRVGLGEHEMVGLGLGLASALDSWAEDDSPNTDGSVIRFPDLGGPTVAMEIQPGTAQPGTA
jgi:serine/threonine-protein kinase